MPHLYCVWVSNFFMALTAEKRETHTECGCRIASLTGDLSAAS